MLRVQGPQEGTPSSVPPQMVPTCHGSQLSWTMLSSIQLGRKLALQQLGQNCSCFSWHHPGHPSAIHLAFQGSSVRQGAQHLLKKLTSGSGRLSCEESCKVEARLTGPFWSSALSSCWQQEYLGHVGFCTGSQSISDCRHPKPFKAGSFHLTQQLDW